MNELMESLYGRIECVVLSAPDNIIKVSDYVKMCFKNKEVVKVYWDNVRKGVYLLAKSNYRNSTFPVSSLCFNENELEDVAVVCEAINRGYIKKK